MMKMTNKIQSFAISQFFAKPTKVWNREIFDLVPFAKINSRENVQFFRPDSYFSQKLFFFSKIL